MAGETGAKKLSPHEVELLKADTEVLRDSDGNFWNISEDYYKSQLDKRVSNDTRHKLAKGLIEDKFPMLSNREREVMVLVTKGCTEGQIAKLLNIKLTSVKTYKKRARNKLKKFIPL